MNYLRSLSLGRKLVLAICVILACLSLGAGLFLPKLADASAAASDAKRTTSAVSETQEGETDEEQPSGQETKLEHEYTSVSAGLYKDGVLIYGNKTTVADLKRNLKVMGTFSDESGSHTVLLKDSEYSVSVSIDDSSFMDRDDDAIVFNSDTVPSGTEIKVLVNCNGSQSGEFSIAEANIKANSDYPDYSQTAFTVAAIGEITNDYTVESMRVNPNLKVMSGTTEIVNREFYEISSLDLNNRTVGVTVNGAEITGAINSVRPATVKSASLTINSSLIKVGDYYKIPEGKSASRFSAFVVSMTQEEILNGLDFTVYFENSSARIPLSFNESGSLQGAQSDVSVSWSTTPDLGTASASRILSLDVRGQSGQGSATATVTIPLEAEKVVDLEIKEGFTGNDKSGKPFAALSDPLSDILDFITAVYNNDYYVRQNNQSKYHAPVTYNDIEMDGTLTPTVDILKTLELNAVYEKPVNIVYKSTNNNADKNYTISTPVTFNVIYDLVPTVEGLNVVGGSVSQTYKTTFDYSRLTVSLKYGNRSIVAPLADFVNDELPENERLVKVTYFSDENYTTKYTPADGIFDINVKSVLIQFRYNSSIDWANAVSLSARIEKPSNDYYSYDLVRSQFRLAAPSLNTSDRSYSTNFTKDFSFITDDNAEMDATQKAVIEGIINDVTVKVEKSEGGKWNAVEGLDSAAIIKNRKIPIGESGTYRVSFKLGAKDTDEVMWGGSGNTDVQDTDTVAYTFTVNPTELELLEINFSTSTWAYGTDFSSYITIKGTPKGMPQDIFEIGTGSGQTDLKYRIMYYSVEDGTAFPYPKDIGKYYVQVDTQTGGNYLKASSADPNQWSGAPVIEVTPKEINYTTINSEIVYGAASHTVDDFIKADDFESKTLSYPVYGGMGTVTYSDTVSSVLTFSDSDTKYTHVEATTPEVTLTLKDDNYSWKDETSTSTTVEIKIVAREHALSITTTESELSFTYGAEKLPTVETDLTSTNGNTFETEYPTFAVVDSAEYYTSEDFGTGDTPASTATPLDVSTFSTWAAGSYVVYFTTSRAEGDEGFNDYTLPTAKATFVISRKQIDKVTFDKDTLSHVYDSEEKQLEFNNWLDGVVEAKVELVLPDESKKELTSEIDNSEGILTVLHAGEYKITVSFIDAEGKQNYDWKLSGTEPEGTKAHDPLTFTYTVEQAEIKFVWANTEIIFDPTQDAQDVPYAETDKDDADFAALATKDGLTYESKIYTDAACENEIEEITSAGTYYIKLTDFKTSDDTLLKLNFKYPATLSASFTVTSAGLVAPVVDTDNLSQTYRGTSNPYQFKTYITNWLAKEGEVDKDKALTYSSTDGTTTTVTAKVNVYVFFNGTIPTGRDFKFTAGESADMTDVATYTVYVYPKDNFQWDEGVSGYKSVTVGGKSVDAFEYSFKITQAQVDIDWGTLEFTYDGTAQKPAPKATNLKGKDTKDNVIITVSGSGKADANVGEEKYTATATSVSGTRGFNYKLPDAKTKEYTIVKRAILRPSANKTSGTFNEEQQSIDFDTQTGFNATVTGWGWSTVVSYTITGQYNFGVTQTHTNVTDAKSGSAYFAFDGDTSKFYFTYAGLYSVTFTIKDEYQKNYYWAGNDKEDYDHDAQSISILRKTVTAPKLGAEQALEYTGEKIKPSITSTSLYSVAYGVYDDYATVNNVAESVDTSSAYFVRLRIKDSSFNPLNYVWRHSGEDKNAYLTDRGLNQYSIKYTDGDPYGVSIYLTYVITGQQLKIEYTHGGYTFGDNGIDQTATLDKNFALVYDENSQDSETVKGALDGGTATPKFTFYALDVETTDFTGLEALGEDQLENGIPWNAGIYGVYIYIEFDSGSNYANIPLSYYFTVAPKSIENVKWIGDETATYDGATHGYTAELENSNIPKRKSESEEQVSIGLVVEWKNNPNKLPQNAGTHTFVIAETADNGVALKSNYVLPETAIEKSLTIQPRTVTVEIDGSEKKTVYGVSSLTFSKYWQYPDGAAESAQFVENTDYITYELWLDNVKVYPNSSSSVLAAKDYALRPVLDTKVTGYGNYTLECAVDGVFTIEARTVTVSLSDNAQNLKAVYNGSGVSLGNVYKVEWTNGSGNWLAAGDSVSSVFTLASGAEAAWADVGSYDVVLTLMENGNYSVTVQGATDSNPDYTWESAFTIVNADITATAAGVEKPYTATAYKYVGELITVTQNILKPQTNAARWYIFAKGDGATAPEATAAGWIEVTAATATDATEGEYWVKVEADNHNPAVLFTPVTVKIAKAELTLSVNLTINYGENNPADYDGNGNIYQIDGLRKPTAAGYNSIYTVEGFKSDADKELFFSEDSENVFGLNGTFTYSAADYIAGTRKKGTYAITISGSTLVSKNYTFKVEEGVLTVVPLKVDITYKTVEDGANIIRAKYYDGNIVGSQLNYATYFTVSTTVASSYGLGTVAIYDADNYNNIFGVTTSALVIESGSVVGTNKVGSYTVTVGGADADKYSFVKDLSDYEGTFVIEGADFEVATTIASIENSLYTEALQSLTGAITVDQIKNNMAVTVSYVSSVTAMSDEAILAAEGVKVENYDNISAPGYLDVSKHYVYFVVRVENHNPQIISKVIEIVKAANSFTTGFAFANAFSSADYDASLTAAWTYGLYTETTTNGYDKDGDHAITAPVSAFSKGEGSNETNAIKYYLFESRVKDLTQADLDGSVYYTDINALFAAWHNASEYKFTHGEYTLYYKIDGTANYTAKDAYVYFSVAKRALTVTADSPEIEYGNTTAYGYKVDGYAYIGSAFETQAIAFGAHTLPVFESEYVAGNDVGTYDITYTAGEKNLTNYTVTYQDGVLNVTPRKVTVVVHQKESSYAYYNDDVKTHKALTYEVISGSFYEEDVEGGDQNKTKAFTLASTAYSVTNEQDMTSDVGEYPIYALFATATYKKNYSVTVTSNASNKLYEGSLDIVDELLVSDNAGVYTVIPAKLAISISVLHYYDETEGKFIAYTDQAKAYVYDGMKKALFATVDDKNINETFTAQYRIKTDDNSNEYSDDLPVDVGAYEYRFVSSNENYSYDTTGITLSFIISANSLSIRAKVDGNDKVTADTQTYKNGEFELRFTFENFVEGEDINISSKVQAARLSGTPSVFNGIDPFGTLSLTRDTERANSFIVEVKNAGVYTVTIDLDGMSNYSMSTYTFTFTVNRNGSVIVNAEDTHVQYGTAILDANNRPIAVTGDRFDGFALKYSDDVVLEEPEGYFITGGVTYTTSSPNGAYNPDNTGAGRTYNITPGNIVAYNYEFVQNYSYGSTGILTVDRREITVRLKGFADSNNSAKVTYDGNSKYNLVECGILTDANAGTFLAPDNNWFGAAISDNNHIVSRLGITLTLKLDTANGKNGVNVGVYDMEIRANAANYDVKFENYSAATPQFEIMLKNLTITAVVPNSGTIVYGNSTDGYFSVKYDGLVEKDRDENGNCIISDDPLFNPENLGFTAQMSTSNYAEWLSHAGETYTVIANGLEFTNYNVYFADTAKMKVVSRAITVLPSNTVYEELDGNYNGGISGKTRIAGVTFTDLTNFDYVAGFNQSASSGIVSTGTISKGETESNTKFKLQYLVNGTWRDKAPDTAGGYQVRIILTGSDFVFDTVNTFGTDANKLIGVTAAQATFEYTVAKKTLNLAWSTSGSDKDFFVWKDADKDNKTISISDFVADILNVTQAQRLYGTNNSLYDNIPVDVPNADGGYYTATNSGFVLHVYGVGTYSITVELNSNAKNNYVIGADAVSITRSFTMSTKGFTITSLSIRDWVYREYNGDKSDVENHNLPVISLSNGLTESIGFAYSYALYTGAALPEGTFYTLPEGANLSFTALLPSDAGTYILQAEYTGTQYATTNAYCVFRITPKQVSAPVFANKSSVDQKEYTSETMTANIEFVSDYFRYTFTKTVEGGVLLPATQSADGFEGLTVTATNAGTYTLTFTLANSNNYAWVEGTEHTGGAVKIEWTIKPSTKNTVTWSSQQIIAEYGDGFPLNATPFFGGEVIYEYAVRTTESTDGVSWTAITSANADLGAGNYWLRAISESTPNYNLASSVIKLTVDRAVLKATAYGSMTYGEEFGRDGTYGYTLSGWKIGEEDVNVGGVAYALTGEYDKLNADSYGITLTSDGGEVNGLTTPNYRIVAEEGEFTVNRKSVGVSVGDGSSVYGEDIDLTDVALSIISGGIVEGDGEEELNISLFVEGYEEGKYLIAGSYRINATGYAESRNYLVSVYPGIYTVTALRVYVELQAGGGEYGNVEEALVISATTSDGTDVLEKFGTLAPSFGFVYSGTANDGTAYNSAKVPSLAGNYTATARIVERINNFALASDTTQSVTFIVSRKAINEAEISVAEIKYDKNAHSPEIIDGEYADLYTVEEVSYTDVGDYSVKLTLTDSDNYKWTSVEGNDYSLPFGIARGENKFLNDVVITGWSFGDNANAPEGETLFGGTEDYVYMYSDSEDGEYTRTVPSAAGTYWVKIVVPQSANYEAQESKPVSFVIGKRAISVPTLESITEGENANSTYTGSRLQAKVLDYDPVIMRIIYEGDISSAGSLAVYAVYAGTYNVYFALNDEANYEWASGTSLVENNAVTSWTVARKKLDKPTMNTTLYMVNGGTLTFTPDGFDESLMAIEGNTTSYGGVFKVTVSLKDVINYEWSDSSVEDITFDWLVVGWDTVFIIVVSVLGVVAGVAAIAIGVQYLVHKRRKNEDALKEAAAAAAIAESVAAATSGATPADVAETSEEAKFEEELNKPEQPAENTEEQPAENAEEQPVENTEEKAEGEKTDEE